MPKNKKKPSKSGAGGRGAAELPSNSDDEGSVFNDAASLDSYASEASTAMGGEREDGVDESSQLELYEGKMREAIDLAGHKAVASRMKALEALNTGFTKRYCPEFTENQQVTIADIVARSVKKGKAAEVGLAGRLSVLLALQLGDCEEVYTSLRPTLAQILGDATASPTSRAAVANSLAGLAFLGGGEMAEVVSVMETLEDIFSASFIKSGGHVPCPPPEVQALHATTLDCWSLLLSLLSPGEVHRRAGKWLKGLTSLLHSSDMELRVTAGESIALVLEFAFDYDEEYAVPSWDELVALLGSLAKDASKARSKRDRKEQRASFRDILRAVEDGDCPNESVKFGKEVLYLTHGTRSSSTPGFAVSSPLAPTSTSPQTSCSDRFSSWGLLLQ